MNKFLIAIVALMLICLNVGAESDFLVEEFIAGKNYPKPETHIDYDYTSTEYIPIKLKVCNDISTRDKRKYLFGEEVNLKVKSNVFYKNKLFLKRGTPAVAKIDQIVESGMNGIPYYIYLNDFEIEGLEASKILADYHKSGLNLVYWVYPVKWALSFLPPSGILTNLIKGGHAKITTADVITVYYFPEWK